MVTDPRAQETQATSKTTTAKRFLRWLDCCKADLVLGALFLLVTVLYARFMFNDRVSTLGLIALGSLWVAHWVITGWRVTPLDAPILGLLLLLPLTLSISIELALTTPKVHGLVLSLSLFYLVVNAVRSKKMLQLAVVGLLVLAIGVSLLGLVGTDWVEDRFINLTGIYESLPHLITDIPRSVGEGGIHKNLIGGALTFFLPLLASFLWDVWGIDFSVTFKNKRRSLWIKILMIILLILATLLAAFVLVLTQSRGGWLGALVGLLALAVIKDWRYLWALPILLLILLTIMQRTAQGDPEIFLTLIDTTRGGTLPGRMEIWRRATLLIQDFPFTGTGIGTFSPLINTFYPYFGRSNPNIPHPHNMILTMAVDLGIPGLILYSGLVGGFFGMVWKTAKRSGRGLRAFLIGLACGLLAHQVFGIMDAYMLGTKLGAILWIFYGLSAAAYRLTLDDSQINLPSPINQSLHSNPGTKRPYQAWLERLGLDLSAWLLLFLLAIAFVNLNVILSLTIAVIGGVMLGWWSIGSDLRTAVVGDG